MPQQAGGGAPVAQRDSSGGFFAAVNANGTGCPPGSWNASISEDGQAFTITFSAFETQVSPTTAVSVKNCVLGFKLESPKGLTFSVPKIYYFGYAFLDEGVKGTQSASYAFRESGITPAQRANELTGPFDNEFLFEQAGGREWAPCGNRRIVNVNTQLRLQNSTPGRNGYMNVAAVDGAVDGAAKLVVKLAWRPCQAPTVRDAGAPSAAPGTVRTTDVGRTAATDDFEVWTTPKVTPR